MKLDMHMDSPHGSFLPFETDLLCVPIFPRHYKTDLRVGYLGTEFPLISQ